LWEGFKHGKVCSQDGEGICRHIFAVNVALCFLIDKTVYVTLLLLGNEEELDDGGSTYL
jgi:hypothetical protein